MSLHAASAASDGNAMAKAAGITGKARSTAQSGQTHLTSWFKDF